MCNWNYLFIQLCPCERSASLREHAHHLGLEVLIHPWPGVGGK
jgi:hypothetical protein